MAESEMVERVARALANGGHLGMSLAFTETKPTDLGSVPKLIKSDTAKAIAAARAALEAMREPTQEMIDAGVTADRGATLGAMFANAHRASIDAALGQEGTEG